MCPPAETSLSQCIQPRITGLETCLRSVVSRVVFRRKRGTGRDYILCFTDRQNFRSILNNYRKVCIPLLRWPGPSCVTVPYLTFDYYLITASLALQVRSHSTSATLLHLRPLAFLQRLFLAATSPDYHRTPPLARVFLEFFEIL